MEDDSSTEAEMLSLDWSSVSEKDKLEIISQHINYVDLSRKAVGASGSYVANIRSLLMIMLITLICMINSAENRTIVLCIMGFQFLKTFFSKIFESGLLDTVQVAKKSLAESITKRVERNKFE